MSNGRILFYGGSAYGCTSTEKPPSLLHPSFRLNFTLYFLFAQENNLDTKLRMWAPVYSRQLFTILVPGDAATEKPPSLIFPQIDESSSCTTLCPGKYFEMTRPHMVGHPYRHPGRPRPAIREALPVYNILPFCKISAPPSPSVFKEIFMMRR